MATDRARKRELESTLKSVIHVLEEGQKGMAEIGEHLEEPPLRWFFLLESLRRANFRAELENVLPRGGKGDVRKTGAAAGTPDRAWAGLKAKLGGGDQTLLEAAEQGEDEACGVYEDALERDLPAAVRLMLTRQQTHILLTRDYIRSRRDEVKAA
jgi:uncharacterized protein (TIGR02284 family)